jgi:glutathione synthase/RimK-type ligase-like ATP-grasp enzyme
MNPASRFCASDPFQLAAALFEQYEGQVVLKQDNGSQGNNVFRIRDQAELQEKLSYFFSLQLNAAISPYYESALEYRVVLLSHVPRIFLAKQRGTSWKHNLISGAVSLEVDAETLPGLKQWASQTTKGMDLDFCSVDLLATAKGLMVLEVNDMVMLDEYLKQDPSRRDKIANLYRDAILARFDKRDSS